MSLMVGEKCDRRNPPIGVSPPWILVAGGIGLFAALVAAFVPAWTAARLPVLTALSGRRPGPAPARRTLSLGIVMIGIAIALTSTGAAMRLRDAAGSMSSLLLLAGAILGTLGFGACSPWLLERLEKPAARLPLASRIALRDTARARSRNGPIVTALLASFAVTVALAAYSASQDATTAAHVKSRFSALTPRVAAYTRCGARHATSRPPLREGNTFWATGSSGTNVNTRRYSSVASHPTSSKRVRECSRARSGSSLSTTRIKPSGIS